MHHEEKRKHGHDRRREERRKQAHGFVIFRFKKGGISMADTLLTGETAIFGEVPTPSGAVLPAGVIPAWTVSDVTVATIPATNPDVTGVTVPVTGVAAGTFTLTVTATLPNGTVIQGTDSITVSAPAPPAPTGLSISKISG